MSPNIVLFRVIEDLGLQHTDFRKDAVRLPNNIFIIAAAYEGNLTFFKKQIMQESAHRKYLIILDLMKWFPKVGTDGNFLNE